MVLVSIRSLILSLFGSVRFPHGEGEVAKGYEKLTSCHRFAGLRQRIEMQTLPRHRSFRASAYAYNTHYYINMLVRGTLRRSSSSSSPTSVVMVTRRRFIYKTLTAALAHPSYRRSRG